MASSACLHLISPLLRAAHNDTAAIIPANIHNAPPHLQKAPGLTATIDRPPMRTRMQTSGVAELATHLSHALASARAGAQNRAEVYAGLTHSVYANTYKRTAPRAVPCIAFPATLLT